MNAADILAVAAQLVTGDRQRSHGDKYRNHHNIATLWNAYLLIRRDPTAQLSPGDVATMMSLLKIARNELGEPNPDNPVDGAAYQAIRGELDSYEPASDS